ncbi:hypothetical protein [Pseudomonas baetica]|uniref:hypothetical protein n=1 Tax=Pseudomonas baetica TaxID=674054 RepID=UPI0024075340|nr:hypothetical protein [Pseudomonas baetica]MDF9773160.1 hypothetical protein [Pseudomonas baetica]
MSFENFSDRTTRKTNGNCFRSIGYRTDYCLGWFFLFNGGADSAGGQVQVRKAQELTETSVVTTEPD